MSEPLRWDLLEYLAPGFLHGLGNALFKVQAFAQLVESQAPASGTEAGPGILSACKDASHLVEIFRALWVPNAQSDPVECGRLVEDLLQMMRGRMREDGLQVVLLVHLERLADAVLPPIRT